MAYIKATVSKCLGLKSHYTSRRWYLQPINRLILTN